MSFFIVRHWKPVAMFSAIFGAYLLCAAPDATWQIPLGDDMGDVMLGATYLRPIHSPGFPVVALTGWCAVHLPGNDFWNMAVFSSLCFVATSILIFLVVRRLTQNKWAPYIAALTFASGPMVFAEAIAPKGPEYALSILFCALTFYFIKSDRKWLAVISAALGIGTHPIAILFCIVLVAVYLRKPKYILAMLCLGALSYLYIPLTIRPPYGQANPDGFFFKIIEVYVVPHVMGLSIADFPRRLLDLGMLIVSSLGLTLLILPKIRRHKDTIVLGSLAAVVLVYCLTTSYTPHLEYLTFALLPVCIMLGQYFGDTRWHRFRHLFILLPLIVLTINTQLYDIGRTLDPEPTVARQVLNTLEELPQDSIVICYYCHVYTLANYYECGENKNNVVAISPSALRSLDWHAEDLRDRGVNIPELSRDVRETWRIFKEANSGRPIYWATLTGTDPLGFKVVPVDDSGLPSSTDCFLHFWYPTVSEWE